MASKADLEARLAECHLALGNLCSHPRNRGARDLALDVLRRHQAEQRLEAALAERERLTRPQKSLQELAAEADQEAAETPGYRRDLDG